MEKSILDADSRSVIQGIPAFNRTWRLIITFEIALSIDLQ